MIPFNQYNLIRAFNRWNVIRTVKKTSNKLGISKPLLITSIPQACDYIGCLGETASIYFCVDEFALWPGLDYALVRKLENKLIASVNLITATSTALAQAK